MTADKSRVRRLKNVAKQFRPLYDAYAGMVVARQRACDFLVRKTRRVIDRRNLHEAVDTSVCHFGSPETVRRENQSYRTAGFDRPFPWERVYDTGIELPRPFLLEMRNAELIGLHGVALDSAGNLMVESTEAEWQYFVKTWSSRQILSRRRTPAQRLSGRIVSLVSPLGDNYFHWISANLARLVALMDAMGGDLADARFLVEQRAPFQAELLKTLLGVPDRRIVPWAGGRASIESLLIPSFLHTRSELTEKYCVHSASAYRRINEIARSNVTQTPPNATPFIIIDRPNASQRRLLNLDLLIRRLGPIGFRVHDLSALSIPDQIGLFRQARIVVGGHGAGLTNMLFTPRAALVELFPAHRQISDTSCYFEVSHALDLPHLAIATPCQSPAQDLALTDTLVDVIEAAVRELLHAN